MTGVRLSDLPPAVQKTIRQQDGAAPVKRRRASGVGRQSGQTWSCPRCPELAPFPSYAAAERHAHTTGHARIELDQ